VDNVRLLGGRAASAASDNSLALAAYPNRTAAAAAGLSSSGLKLQRDSNTFYLTPVDTLADGERVMSVQIEQVTVTSRMRSVPERNGHVVLDFIVTLPKQLLGRSRNFTKRLKAASRPTVSGRNRPT